MKKKELHPALNSDKNVWNKENEIENEKLQKKVKSKKQEKSLEKTDFQINEKHLEEK